MGLTQFRHHEVSGGALEGSGRDFGLDSTPDSTRTPCSEGSWMSFEFFDHTRQQNAVIEYLREENRVLKSFLSP